MSEPAPPSRRRRCCGLLALPLLLGLLGLGAVVAIEGESAPTGEPGAAAEALAKRLEEAVRLEAWEETRAVRWTFAGRNEHLWDRKRGLLRVVSGQRRVLLHLAGAGLSDNRGRAWEGERELADQELQDALAWAWSAWCNDSFWLNPIAKLRDGGVELQACPSVGGRERLLVRYPSGGVTPGDRYLWELGSDGLPVNWKMWVSIIPIGGVDTSWEGWIELGTGAKVATEHRFLGGVTLRLSEVAGAESLSELVPGPDPFADLDP